MGRPKAVSIKTFPQYNLLHTEKVKMYSGVYMTALFPIKETEQFYLSIEVWSHMCSKFKRKKAGFELKLDIPTITDEKTINFLAEHAWHDWVEKEKSRKQSDTAEVVEYLNKIFPDKKKVFFYELDSILTAYAQGTFISYDDNGEIEKPSEHDIDTRKYYTHKYERYVDHPTIKALFEAYHAEKDEVKKKECFTKYHTAEREYVYKHRNLDSVFMELGKNGVAYPVAFSDGTADWYKKEYGKVCPYAHAGEIYFVVTPDTIYFERKRHF
jgi:hypothetical protein